MKVKMELEQSDDASSKVPDVMKDVLFAQVNMATLELRELLSEKADRQMFVHLLKRMLSLDGSKRITPLQALSHPFLSATPRSQSRL